MELRTSDVDPGPPVMLCICMYTLSQTQTLLLDTRRSSVAGLQRDDVASVSAHDQHFQLKLSQAASIASDMVSGRDRCISLAASQILLLYQLPVRE